MKTKKREDDQKKELLARIHKIQGQVNGIEKMIINDKYCDDVLIQLSAIDKSIKSLANVILDEHMHTCLVECIKNNELEEIDNIVTLFKRFQ